jgi:nicotinate-nucleotide adenylyltransferase
MKKKVAVFGGSFNPPHVGHVLAAALVLSTQEPDLVLVVPAYRHPFGKPLAPYEHRVTLCRLAMGWLPRVEVSRVEEELGGESRTLRTLEELESQHADWEMRLVLGSDTFAETPKWYRFDLVEKLAPPLVLERCHPGEAHPASGPALLPAISSTEVRALIADKSWDALSNLVPASVLSHVREHGLYAGRDPSCASTSSGQAK